MQLSETTFKKIKNKYLKFIKSQEVLSEPFRDKMGQLKNFYLPICENIIDLKNFRFQSLINQLMTDYRKINGKLYQENQMW